jgi:hypothetical protein
VIAFPLLAATLRPLLGEAPVVVYPSRHMSHNGGYVKFFEPESSPNDAPRGYGESRLRSFTPDCAPSGSQCMSRISRQHSTLRGTGPQSVGRT